MAYNPALDTEDPSQASAPLVPRPGQTPSPTVDSAAQTGGLADQWRGWMADPHNRAAMIQFGVALSQPIGAGQNALGQIGGAFGQAGEASDRITAQELAQEEAASKQELRKSQADLAGERATHAGDVSLAHQQTIEERRRATDLADQAKIAKAYTDHLNYVARTNKILADQNLVAGKKGKQQPLLEPMTAEDFAARYRGMGGAGGIAPVAGGGAGAGAEAPVRVQSPAELSKYPSGTRYVTPDGRTGTVP